MSESLTFSKPGSSACLSLNLWWMVYLKLSLVQLFYYTLMLQLQSVMIVPRRLSSSCWIYSFLLLRTARNRPNSWCSISSFCFLYSTNFSIKTAFSAQDKKLPGIICLCHYVMYIILATVSCLCRTMQHFSVI